MVSLLEVWIYAGLGGGIQKWAIQHLPVVILCFFVLGMKITQCNVYQAVFPDNVHQNIIRNGVERSVRESSKFHNQIGVFETTLETRDGIFVFVNQIHGFAPPIGLVVQSTTRQTDGVGRLALV
jgi:hypothetical protein